MGFSLWRWGLAWAAAVLAASLAGAAVQTQFNLAALAGLGLEIPVTTRLVTTWQDLLGFAPRYAPIVAINFLLALPLAEAVALRRPAVAPWLHVLAAALGLGVALALVDALAPPPTLIAATRGGDGRLAMMASAGLGGWVFVACRRRLAGRY